MLLKLYDDTGGYAPIGTQEDRYYVHMSLWLTQESVGKDIPSIENPQRAPAINALLKWIIACGLSEASQFSDDALNEGHRVISAAASYLPYDGFSFRQYDAPRDVYLRFIA